MFGSIVVVWLGWEVLVIELVVEGGRWEIVGWGGMWGGGKVWFWEEEVVWGVEDC